jgi:hypothetical protein
LKFWEEFNKFSSLKKLSIDLSGKIDSEEVLVDSQQSEKGYTVEIAAPFISKISSLTDLALAFTTNRNDRNPSAHPRDEFYKIISQSMLHKLENLSVKDFDCPPTLF